MAKENFSNDISQEIKIRKIQKKLKNFYCSLPSKEQIKTQTEK